MAYLNRADKKYCSTCEFWTGEREITRTGSQYFVKHLDTAKCEVKAMGPNNMSGNQVATCCRKYKRWNHLPD
jgi:hypothetical protein